MKIQKKYVNDQEACEVVVDVLTRLHNISLAEKELKLFTILTFDGPLTRDVWFEKFGGSKNTFKNTLTKLKGKKLFKKVDDVYESKLPKFKKGDTLDLVIKISQSV